MGLLPSGVAIGVSGEAHWQPRHSPPEVRQRPLPTGPVGTLHRAGAEVEAVTVRVREARLRNGTGVLDARADDVRASRRLYSGALAVLSGGKRPRCGLQSIEAEWRS